MNKKIFSFLKRYAIKHPLYVIAYAFGYFSSTFAFSIHFFSEEEVRTMLQKGRSIIRLGDGEINLLLGIKNHYHSFSPILGRTIKDIVQGYTRDSEYVLAIPKAIGTSNAELKKIERFNVWMPFKTFFLLCFPKQVGYMDAHAFYRDGYFERIVAPLFIERTVVIITNKETLQKIKSNERIPWKQIAYVETPQENSLLSESNIKDAIDSILSKNTKQNTVLLFALGPVGKGLIRKYAKEGYQSIDVGRGIETMFTNDSIEALI